MRHSMTVLHTEAKTTKNGFIRFFFEIEFFSRSVHHHFFHRWIKCNFERNQIVNRKWNSRILCCFQRIFMSIIIIMCKTENIPNQARVLFTFNICIHCKSWAGNIMDYFKFWLLSRLNKQLRCAENGFICYVGVSCSFSFYCLSENHFFFCRLRKRMIFYLNWTVFG